MRAGEPAGALGAVLRLAAGPTGYGDAFPGFDMLLFLNLSGHDLLNPELGIMPAGGSANFTQALLTEGFLNDPAFGGNGALTLASLGMGDVYATLAPTSDTVLNVQAGGAGPVADASLANGGVLYLTATPVPEPSSMALLGAGVIGVLGLARVRRCGPLARDAGTS